MNVYAIIFIVGFVMQLLGGIGFLVHTRLKETTSNTVVDTQIVDNETGSTIFYLNGGSDNTHVYKKYKFVERAK